VSEIIPRIRVRIKLKSGSSLKHYLAINPQGRQLVVLIGQRKALALAVKT
jgi:hypothetical protein